MPYEFKNILNYPSKRYFLHYLFVNPTLLLALVPFFNKYYFSKKIGPILGKEYFDSLLYLLPEKFLKQIKPEFTDPIGHYLLLYLIIRANKPKLVIETGVKKGFSSAFILCGLYENGSGKLISIDLPPEDTPNPGSFVPDYLKENWTLLIGDSKLLLPTLLKENKSISIFFHDSLHTYDHMMFEYTTAWPFIEKNGLLISHDVIQNLAFFKFAQLQKIKPEIYFSLGVVKK